FNQLAGLGNHPDHQPIVHALDLDRPEPEQFSPALLPSPVVAVNKEALLEAGRHRHHSRHTSLSATIEPWYGRRLPCCRRVVQHACESPGSVMIENPNREKEIFERALDLASADERYRYLESACGGDTVLLTRVQALLRADEAGEAFLPEQPRESAHIVTE